MTEVSFLRWALRHIAALSNEENIRSFATGAASVDETGAADMMEESK